MSILITTTINSFDSNTNLTLQTGNSAASKIVLGSGLEGVILSGNSTSNTVFVTPSTVQIDANVHSHTLSTNSISTNTVTANVVNTNTVVTNNIVGNVSFSNTITFSSNVTTSTINTTAINIANASISTTGYTRMFNGLLYQWGSIANVTSSAGLITFPIEFAANPYSVVVTPTLATAATLMAVQAVNTSTATVRSVSGSTANTAYWMAIGV